MGWRARGPASSVRSRGARFASTSGHGAAVLGRGRARGAARRGRRVPVRLHVAEASGAGAAQAARPPAPMEAKDEHGLARALSAFNESISRPSSGSSASWRSSRPASRASEWAAYGTALGSLFNFAKAPDELPIVVPRSSRRLQRRSRPGGRPEGSCRTGLHHLAFGKHMQETFAGAGLPVRGMINTEALILICWEDRQLLGVRRGWLEAPESRARSLPGCSAIYLTRPTTSRSGSIHRLAGFQGFYFSHNFSADHHREVLEPFIAEGLVVMHDWPQSRASSRPTTTASRRTAPKRGGSSSTPPPLLHALPGSGRPGRLRGSAFGLPRGSPRSGFRRDQST